jgi:hypothetical protein
VKELAQPHVPAPVLAAGILQPAGTWAAYRVGHTLPLVGELMHRRADHDAGAFTAAGATRTGLFALTDDKLYAFDARPAGSRWRVGEQVVVWERKDLEVETTAGKLATKVVIGVVSTGERYELEVTTAPNHNGVDAFLEELQRASAS